MTVMCVRYDGSVEQTTLSITEAAFMVEHARICGTPVHLFLSVRPTLIRRVEESAERLNAIPWWKPIKRQDAAEDYKRALLAAAYDEIELGLD